MPPVGSLGCSGPELIHAASLFGFLGEVPDSILDFMEANRRLTSRMIFLRGEQVRAMYKPCYSMR